MPPVSVGDTWAANGFCPVEGGGQFLGYSRLFQSRFSRASFRGEGSSLPTIPTGKYTLNAHFCT